MRRPVAVVLCLGLMAADRPARVGREAGERPRPPGVPASVPELRWSPRPGDVASVRAGTLAAIDLGWYDAPGGRNVPTGDGVEAEVVRPHGAIFGSSAPASTSVDGFLEGLQSGGVAGPPPSFPVEVRLLGGPSRGKVVVLSYADLSHLIPNPRPWLDMKEGDVVRLVDPSIPVAYDLASYWAFQRASSRDDDAGVSRLLRLRKGFRLAESSRVAVVELFHDFGHPEMNEVARVKVLGQTLHNDKVGFVYRGNLCFGRPSPVAR